MAQYRDGQYYYARHRNMWGVWQYHSTGNGDGYGEFIDDFPKRDDALYEVYKRNGSTTHKLKNCGFDRKVEPKVD